MIKVYENMNMVYKYLEYILPLFQSGSGFDNYFYYKGKKYSVQIIFNEIEESI